jgi:drug/metabolite transporter (DMT)-like permease
MSFITILPWLWLQPATAHITWSGWWLVFLLGGMTALARLTMFLGVKGVGSLQTALIGVAEVIVTIALAGLFLQETLTLIQWGGAGLLVLSLLLVKYDRVSPPAGVFSVA